LLPDDLPTLNAVLNCVTALLLLIGYGLIRVRRIAAHRICMTTAVLTSALFLVSYVIHHLRVGSVKFEGTGMIRLVYFAVLISHTVLATAIVPLVLATLVRALRGRFERHAALARVTLPIWLYVSITGVIVYWMLYRLPFG
jgi:putative membrane protein